MNESQHADREDPADDVVLAARTDSHALGRLFDHFYPLILAYCLRRLLDRAVAEDVTSETFLKVAARFRDFSGTCAEDFRRWLFRIATNEINAYLRQSIRRRKLLEKAAQLRAIRAADGLSPPAEEFSWGDWESLYAALEQLPVRDQSIISLRYFAGLQHDQIGAVLDLESGNVRVALSRALHKLRDHLRGSAELPHKSHRRVD